MSVNDWFAYQDKKSVKDEETKPIVKRAPNIDINSDSSIDVVESTPSDTFIQRMRQGIADKMK